jgi:hypothetical protein
VGSDYGRTARITAVFAQNSDTLLLQNLKHLVIVYQRAYSGDGLWSAGCVGCIERKVECPPNAHAKSSLLGYNDLKFF